MKVELPNDATPVIQETIVIVSELPKQTPRVKINEVDGGLSQELEFEVNAPSEDPASYFDAGDRIELTLPGFTLPATVSISQIEISSGNRDEATPTEVEVDNNKLILTLPGSVAPSPGEHIVITIKGGSGILSPEIPRGFDDPDHRDDPDEAYAVGITLIDNEDPNNPRRYETTDENAVVVRNPLSSTVPSATRVQVTLVTNTRVQLSSSDEITVDFSAPSADSEFVIPPSISTSSVRIYPEGVEGKYFNPSNILVQGDRVTLTIPSTTPDDRADPNIGEDADYAIRFQPGARIGNPYAAGNRVIKVWSSEDREAIDEITAVIKRTTTIDTQEGPRGTEFILRGKGYPKGTVTVYHDADCDGNIDAGETLASDTTEKGEFSVDLVARDPRELGTPECLLDPLAYRVKTKDSEGVDDEVVFEIKSGMFFVPSPARVGSPLKITISDWQEDYEDVVAISIAGEEAYVAEVREYDNCFDYTGVFVANSDGVISMEVVVPRFVPGGEQTVAVYDDSEELNLFEVPVEVGDNPLSAKPDCEAVQDWGAPTDRVVTAELRDEPDPIIKETIEIVEQNLMLTPYTAARGQKVTITGTGFTRGARGDDHIESVWIGGQKVPDDHSEFEVGTEGSIAFTVTVPLDVADGDNEVLIEGADDTLGRATLDIPAASITLNPPQGQRGTELTVTGSGFVAKEAVLLSYHSGALITSATTELAVSGILADSQGGFELTFKVPVAAEVGLSHLITATAKADTPSTIKAEASHLVTQTDIMTTPGSVSPGDHLTISAHRMPPFTLVGPVKIAGIPLNLPSEVATDEDGSFETKVLIPHIEYGDQILLVQVAGVIIPHVVEVAPPPLSGPPAQVFKYLIRSGVLSTVWHYDNAAHSWSLFDSSLNGEMAELNDLTEVNSGDIVWVNMNEPQFFQGSSLVVGWNLISLK